MRILFFLYLTFSFSIFGQMEFSTLQHDFGTLESYDHRFIDIIVTNKGPKEGYILSVRKPEDVVYLQSRALIQKDSSLVLRFQVNPRQRGKFNYTVDVITSDKAEPTKIKLSGNLLHLDNNGSNYLTACPDFNSTPSKVNQKPFEYTVITIDETTREPLAQTQVRLIQDGFQVWKQPTDKTGRITQKGQTSMVYFYAQRDGYLPAEKGTFLSPERNRIIVEMKKDPNYLTPPLVTNKPILTEPTPSKETPQVTVPITEVEIAVNENPPSEKEIKINWPKKKEKEIPPIPSPAPDVARVSLDSLPPDNFDTQYFKPINVAFVLDISSSMAQNNKMDLMKFALNELTDMIRPTDKISLVTYATDAKVILPPTNGMDKDAIRDRVRKLKASGMTAGSAGIKKGFEQVTKSLLKDGVNHVFILTDGAFNRQTEDIQKMVKKYRKQGISLSVVGIVNQPRDEENMRAVAQLARGEYIPIFKLEDATNNIPQMIRRLAFY